MSRLIVDASVAVKWFVLEDQSDRALSLLDSDAVLIAPDFIRLEVASALSRRVREGYMALAEVSQANVMLPRYFSEMPAAVSLLDDALALSIALKHPLYDCIYLSLAKARQAIVVTADEKFVAKVSKSGSVSSVVLLSRWRG